MNEKRIKSANRIYKVYSRRKREVIYCKDQITTLFLKSLKVCLNWEKLKNKIAYIAMETNIFFNVNDDKLMIRNETIVNEK